MPHLILASLFYLFIVIGFINLLHFGLYLVGANIYDFQNWRRLKSRKSSPDKALVSVLIPAFNEEKVIERCLKSVWNNTYEKIQIVVVNDGSSDATAAAVRRFITSRGLSYSRTQPRIVRTRNGLKRQWYRGRSPILRQVRLVEQANSGKARALNRALKYHAKGDLVMTLDADSLIHKQAIARAVSYFDDPNVAGVAANVRIIEEFTVLGILQRFEHMIGYRSKKFFTAANCELIIGGVASTYRKQVLKSVRYYDTNTVTEDIGLSMKIAARGNKKYKLVYGADVAAMTEGVADFKALLAQRFRWKLGNLQNLIKYRRLLFSKDDRYTRTLGWYRVPMAFVGELLILLEVFVLAYVLYLSIRYFTIGLILGAYMTITLYILLIIWPDEHMDKRSKLRSSLLAPWLYFIFYIMNAVQIISIVRCLMDSDKIFHLKNRKNTWISPRRLGKAISFN